LLAAATVAAGLALASGASAATVQGTFDGSFDNLTGADPGIVINGLGSNEIEWGTDTTSPTSPVSNSLSISPGGFSGSFPPDGELLVGSWNWINQSTFNAGGTWNVDMTLNVSFTSPSAIGPLTEVINIEVANTSDQSTDPDDNEQSGQFPDVVSNLTLAVGAFGAPINLGGGLVITDFFLRMTACTPNPGTEVDPSCTFDAATGVWTLREGGESTIALVANVANVAPVPLPAAAWMLLAGLGGLGLIRSRRKAAA
jgi:hypothetical protein